MARNKSEDKPPRMIKEIFDRVRKHQIQIFAAAVAFFAFVALIPALVATVSIVGLVADTDQLVTEVEAALDTSPKSTRDFVVGQLRAIADSDDAGVGFAAVVGVALALFSSSSAVGNLMSALNVVSGRTETRNWIKKRAQAIALLLGSIVVLAAVVGVMAVLPELLEDWDGHPAVEAAITLARFVGLALIMAAGLSVLYRVGPAPKPDTTIALVPGGKRELVSVGAVIGTGLFVTLSWAFGVFIRNFGSYNETYGTLASIIIVLIWLQLTALAVLIGAIVDAVRADRKIADARSAAGLSRKPAR